jgi:cytochrome c-type biogenesis protein CcmH
MTFLRSICVLVLLFAGVALAQVQTEKPPIALSTEQEARFKALLPNLRCLVCQNESLADSQAPLAQDLRYEIRGLLAQGDSDFQVKKYLTDRYGEFILYRPAVELKTYLLWFGPLLLLVIGLVTLYRFTRRRQNAAAAPAVDQAALRKLLDDDAG